MLDSKWILDFSKVWEFGATLLISPRCCHWEAVVPDVSGTDLFQEMAAWWISPCLIKALLPKRMGQKRVCRALRWECSHVCFAENVLNSIPNDSSSFPHSLTLSPPLQQTPSLPLSVYFWLPFLPAPNRAHDFCQFPLDSCISIVSTCLHFLVPVSGLFKKSKNQNKRIFWSEV